MHLLREPLPPIVGVGCLSWLGTRSVSHSMAAYFRQNTPWNRVKGRGHSWESELVHNDPLSRLRDVNYVQNDTVPRPPSNLVHYPTTPWIKSHFNSGNWANSKIQTDMGYGVVPMSYFGGNKAPYLLWSHLDGATKYLTKCQPGSVFGSCIMYLRRWGVICGDRSDRMISK